jgi:hypothetical protein
MDQNDNGVFYLKTDGTKIKDGIFVRLHIRAVLRDSAFEEILSEVEGAASRVFNAMTIHIFETPAKIIKSYISDEIKMKFNILGRCILPKEYICVLRIVLIINISHFL